MIRDAVEELNLRSTILDGEILTLDEEGTPRFQLLQKWQKRPTAPVVYVLFDLLWDNGRDLTSKSVIQRREQLQEIITPVTGIQVGGYLEKRGIDLFRLAKEKGLEGIVAKRKGSTDQTCRLSDGWATRVPGEVEMAWARIAGTDKSRATRKIVTNFIPQKRRAAPLIRQYV